MKYKEEEKRGEEVCIELEPTHKSCSETEQIVVNGDAAIISNTIKDSRENSPPSTARTSTAHLKRYDFLLKVTTNSILGQMMAIRLSIF